MCESSFIALKEHDAAWRRHLYLTLIRKRVRPGSGSSQEFLRARTWRIPVFDLRALVQTPFVIVGGVATRLYSPERMTDDLDVLILAQNAKAFYGKVLKTDSHWILPDGTPLDVLESDETWAQEAKMI